MVKTEKGATVAPVVAAAAVVAAVFRSPYTTMQDLCLAVAAQKIPPEDVPKHIAAIEALNADPIKVEISEKSGCIMIRGARRYPISLYVNEWKVVYGAEVKAQVEALYERSEVVAAECAAKEKAEAEAAKAAADAPKTETGETKAA